MMVLKFVILNMIAQTTREIIPGIRVVFSHVHSFFTEVQYHNNDYKMTVQKICNAACLAGRCQN